MQSRAGELNPYQGERQPSLGWRYVKASARLLRESGTLLSLALLSAVGAMGVLALGYLVGSAQPGLGGGSDFALALVVTGGVILVFTFCAVAACVAVDAALDGVPLRLGEALGDTVQNLGPVLGWAALSTALWVTWRLSFSHALIIAIVIASLVLYLCSFFVLPLIAIGAAGPIEAFSESLRLMRERGWAAIGGLLGLIAATLVPWFLLFQLSEHARAEQHLHGDGLVLLLIANAVAVVLLALVSITRAAFATLLFREVFGDLPPGIYLGPRRSWGKKALRLAGAVVVAFVIVGISSSATRHDRMVNNQGPGHYYTVGVDSAAAVQLESGSPVVFHEARIGTVLAVEEKGELSSRISIHLDPGYDPVQTPGFFQVEDCLGRLSLVLTPRNEVVPENAQTL
jgi:hypothetical protein